MLDNINKIKQYVLNVKNISPLRIGNGEKEGNGILLYDNHAVINGTTLSGLFREFLKQYKEKEVYELVFPRVNDEKNEDEDNKKISKIYFYDAISQEKIKLEDLSFRNHINIDVETGSSVENHLFNECHITEGKTFRLFFEIRGLELEEDKYENLCRYLEQFICEISKGEIAVGSKTTFGFGRFNAIEHNKLYYKEYDLSIEKGLDDYLNFNVDSLVLGNLETKDISKCDCKSNKVKVSLKAYCDEGFIIKGQQIVEKDKVFDKSYQEYINLEDMYVIPSSTIKGIVKNYCSKICKTLGKEDEKIIDNIFGKKTNENDNEKGKKGTMTFEDCKIEEGKSQIYNRIKIDRFTGGVMTGSTFKEQLAVVSENNPVEFNVIVNKKDKKALALIILAFRDIGLGYVTVGSGNNIGYGRFKGRSITIDGMDYNKKVIFQDSRLIGNVDEINDIISILKE
ncbi:RAMP superfamily CRISPR-associated protein [Haloimpatiens sp. FM7330]|uniref:RAMP superfamily CRISPR-associated protein n=1 Tax=Haloimpatiens sp. FM7330 TaxID=3298610 RepID=UPI00362D00A6